jgi:opacity protein-like surface antigen
VALRAFLALALLLTLAAGARAQTISEARVREAIDDAAGGLGQALGGGSPLTGPASTTGGLLGLRTGLSLGLSAADIEDPRRPAGEIDVVLPVGSAHAAVGLTRRVDVLGKIGLLAAGNDYEGIALTLGLGARVGLLRDAPALPDVSASLYRTWVDGLEFGELVDDEVAFDADVATWSLRLDASQGFGVVTPYAGVGLDRTGIDADYRIPSSQSSVGTEIEGSIDTSDTHGKAYVGAELNLLVLRAAAEIGAGAAGTFLGVAVRLGP